VDYIHQAVRSSRVSARVGGAAHQAAAGPAAQPAGAPQAGESDTRQLVKAELIIHIMVRCSIAFSETKMVEAIVTARTIKRRVRGSIA